MSIKFDTERDSDGVLEFLYLRDEDGHVLCYLDGDTYRQKESIYAWTFLQPITEEELNECIQGLDPWNNCKSDKEVRDILKDLKDNISDLI